MGKLRFAALSTLNSQLSTLNSALPSLQSKLRPVASGGSAGRGAISIKADRFLGRVQVNLKWDRPRAKGGVELLEPESRKR